MKTTISFLKRKKAFHRQAGVTFLELLITVVLLAFVTLAVFTIFGDYVYRSRRLSKMTYSNQAIENLRTTIFRDMRAATRFTISDDGTQLWIECAVDEAAVRDSDLDKNNALSQEDSSLYDFSLKIIFGENTDVQKLDTNPDNVFSGVQSVYYTILYTFTSEDVYTTQFPLNKEQLAEEPPGTVDFDASSGLWHIKRGIVTRTGATMNAKIGATGYDEFKDAMVDQWADLSPSTVVSRDWLYITPSTIPSNMPNAAKVFAYWSPDNPAPNRDNALAVYLTLYSRDIFALGARESGYRQAFETFVTTRTRR